MAVNRALTGLLAMPFQSTGAWSLYQKSLIGVVATAVVVADRTGGS